MLNTFVKIFAVCTALIPITISSTYKMQSGYITNSVYNNQEALLHQTNDKLLLSKQELFCLTKNVFHEAGVESKVGKVAVAQVTLNRLKSKKWGNTVCSVVHSKAQFSWTLQKKKVRNNPKGKLWNDSVNAVHEFTHGLRVKGLEKSHFYHTDYIVAPKWTKSMKVVTKIDQHIFYNDV